MTKDKTRNLAESVHQRLRNRAKEVGRQDFQWFLIRYGLERLMFRISISEYADQYVVKGATLFTLWEDLPFRPTRDLDLEGSVKVSPEQAADIMRKICRIDVRDDGLKFLDQTVRARLIREDREEQGVRVQLTAMLGNSRIPISVDIAFSVRDTGTLEKVKFPTILDFPAPKLMALSREIQVAEKLEAILSRGMLTSRMKDFYDIWQLSANCEFDGSTLQRAIEDTFSQRETKRFAETPVALTHEFYDDRNKQTQWTGFIRKRSLDVGGQTFEDVVESIRGFLMPVTEAITRGESFQRTWSPGGPWG